MQLHRADVVNGALALLDTDGLDALTMRKLATHLGVQAGALYWHFRDKRALLDAMAERLVEGVGEPVPDGTWDERLTVLAGRVHRALLSHRDGARVVAGTYVAESNHRLAGRLSVTILREAGLPLEQAIWATFTLLYYILGHTVEEQAQAELVARGEWAAKKEAYLISPAAGDDTTEAVGQAFAGAFAADPEVRFGYGLRLFLDGIRAQLPNA